MSTNPSTVKRLMAKRCDMCPFCGYARANPDKPFSKMVQWHGKFCPFWHAWQEVYGDQGEGEPSPGGAG